MSLARTRIAKRQHVFTAINESALKQRLYLPLQLRRKTLQFKTRKAIWGHSQSKSNRLCGCPQESPPVFYERS